MVFDFKILEANAMTHLTIPPHYDGKLSVREVEAAIKLIKDTFEDKLADALHLERVSAPLFVCPETGLNDNLNGIERPVTFSVPAAKKEDVQIVHSLAKWKRMALYKYRFSAGEGLYTDMNAIRRDEEPDNLHSIYVDQWDWEKVITKEDRTLAYLQDTVKKIYKAMQETNQEVCQSFPVVFFPLPEEIFFITTSQLEAMYPKDTPKERENKITKEKKAVFLMQIGDLLSDGKPHDGRAPDYDDWALNGDILLWSPVLECAFEVSSMGIRVDSDSLLSQLAKNHCGDRLSLPFHTMLKDGILPLSIGGGIGQSRLCMYFLQRAHIGEVQVSLWPDEMIQTCEEHRIPLL